MKNPKVDKFVSGGIVKRGFWEKHIVMEVMKGVDKYPNSVFLDIGHMKRYSTSPEKSFISKFE